MEKRYETVFITTPVLSEDQMKETVEKFRNILKKNQAEVVHEENWGLRKLAYPIDKKSTGFYHLIEYKVEGDVVDNLEVEFKRDERIIRFLTVKMDKYAIEYAEKRRNQKSTNTQQPEPEKEK
jgi:small subunit ribosomal protein S6